MASQSGQADLLEYIDFRSVECLNQQPAHPIGNALKQGYRDDQGLYLESDTDDQLLIHIPFNQAVKLNSLVIKSSETKGKGPRQIRLFKNTPSIGFGEAESAPAIQEFELTEKDLEGEALTLRFVKFQSLTSLSIFVANNQEDEDTTQIQKIAIFGQSGETMNVADIKKAGEEDNK
ncbi:hypothetical protein ABBQ38_012542 [Trebouxia sp. C0009 RCD-2024]